MSADLVYETPLQPFAVGGSSKEKTGKSAPVSSSSGFGIAVSRYGNNIESGWEAHSEATPDFSACERNGENARYIILSESVSYSISPTQYQDNNNPLPEQNEPVKQQEKSKPRKRKKTRLKTTNRKHITTSGSITHNGKEYRINNGKGKKDYELYTPILHKIIEQFQVAQSKWGRVAMLRIELHLPHNTQDSKCVTDFRHRLIQRLRRYYGIKDIGYAWVRERHGIGKAQHYHYALFLDGGKVNHPKKLTELARASWVRPMGGYNLGYIENAFYFIDNEKTALEAIYRLSYLAKTKGKGNRPPQAKDYQCSRMKG